MVEQDHNPGQHQASDDLDRMLDAALAKYSAVEPRAGLEKRILANLHPNARVPERVWWRGSVAAAVAAVIVVAVALAWRSGKSAKVVTEHRPSTTQGSQQSGTQQVAAHDGENAVRPQVPGYARRTAENRSRHHPALVVAAAPKLDTFPSPQPLSEQERILESYVTQFHAQAALIASVTNEELQRDRMELMSEPQGFAERGNQDNANR